MVGVTPELLTSEDQTKFLTQQYIDATDINDRCFNFLVDVNRVAWFYFGGALTFLTASCIAQVCSLILHS
jgi:hypothetical protein